MTPLVIEMIGIVSTLFILVSMLFKTTSYKGSLIMRILNLIGCACFSIYGCLLPAVSTAVLNIALVIINAVHLIILVREHKKSEENL